MDYLIVAATVLEVKPLLDRWDLEEPNVGESTIYQVDNNSVTFLIGGVGMMSMSYHIGRKLQQQQYDLVLNVGIAGSFDESYDIGSLVVVKSQQYADLGASSPSKYEDFFEMGFLNPNEFPFEDAKIYCPDLSYLKDYVLPEVTSISVNTVSGKKGQIERHKQKYHPQIEVMEGIAVHYACRLNETPYLEIRAISNMVEVRDKTKWRIKEAIENLNDFLVEWFTT